METPKKRFFLFRFIDFICEIGAYLSAFLLWVIAVIVTYEVAMRYLFNSPTTWVSESSVYLWMAVGLLGAANTLKNDGHFSITILVDALSQKNRKRLQIITKILGMLYSASFVYYGYQQAYLAYDLEDVSNGLMATPLWIPWSLVPIGGALLTLQFINKLADEFAN